MELFAPWRNKSKGTATSRVFLFFNRNLAATLSFIFLFHFKMKFIAQRAEPLLKWTGPKKVKDNFFPEKQKRKNVHVISAWLRSWQQCMELWGIPRTTQKQFVTGLAWTLAHRLGRNVEEVIHKHATIIWVDSSSLNFNSLAWTSTLRDRRWFWLFGAWKPVL